MGAGAGAGRGHRWTVVPVAVVSTIQPAACSSARMASAVGVVLGRAGGVELGGAGGDVGGHVLGPPDLQPDRDDHRVHGRGQPGGQRRCRRRRSPRWPGARCRTPRPSPPACRGRRPCGRGTGPATSASGSAASSDAERRANESSPASARSADDASSASMATGDAVVRLQQDQPERPRSCSASRVEQVLEVAERLRHLLARAVDDEGVVHPVVGEALAEGDGLGPLVLVVRELAGPARRSAGRSPRRAGRGSSPRTRCASPAGPRPTATATYGSPGLASFHRAKSAGWRFCVGAVDLPLAAAGEHVVERLLGQERRSPRPSRRRGTRRRRWCTPGRSRRARRSSSTISSTYAVACGMSVGRSERRCRPSPATTPSRSSRRDLAGVAALGAGPLDDLVVDVGDVRHQPDVEPGPASGSGAARRTPTSLRPWPRCGGP